MEILIGAVVALLVLRLLLSTIRRGAMLLLLVLAGLHLLGRIDPQLTAAFGGPLLLLFVVLMGFRLMTRGLTG